MAKFKLFGRKKREQKASAVGRLLSMMRLGEAVWTPRNYAGYAEEAYQKNIIAYRCIHLIASNASAAPLLAYRGDQELPTHEALDLLNNPNPQMSQSDFIEALIAYRLLSGNRYIERVGPDARRTRELWPLRPDRMKVVPGRDGTVAGFVYSVNGAEQTFWNDPTQPPVVLHGKTFNPVNDWYGQAPLEAAAMSVDSHNDATRWNKKLLQNDVRPSGALMQSEQSSSDGPLDDDTINRLRAELDERRGPEAAGRPMLLEGGLKWVQMMLSHHDIDWLGGKELSAKEIALALNVPEQLVGVKGQQTYNNYKEARLALWEDAILPELYSLCAELTQWFRMIYRDPKLKITIDEDKISALAPRREALWDKVEAANDLTINEKRLAKGYSEVPGGDVLLVPATLIPLEMASESFEIDGPAPPGNKGAPETKGAGAYDRELLYKLAYGEDD